VNPCLVILNPRRVPEALAAFDEVDLPKCWLTGYTENELQKALPAAVELSDYSHYVAVSDDVVVTPEAVGALLDVIRRTVGINAVTGWCNLDQGSHAHLANISLSRLPAERPSVGSYSFAEAAVLEQAKSPTVRSWFAGMCLTGMSRRLWQQFPFRVYRGQRGKGFASDYHLSWRLQQANVPVGPV
jgi:hypothetical protein